METPRRKHIKRSHKLKPSAEEKTWKKSARRFEKLLTGRFFFILGFFLLLTAIFFYSSRIIFGIKHLPSFLIYGIAGLAFILLLVFIILKKAPQELKKQLPWFAFILLISVIPAILLRQNLFLVFFACSSFGFMIYGKLKKNQTSIIISFIFLLLMILTYIYQWVFIYFPSLFLQLSFWSTGLLLKAITAGFFVNIVLFLNRILLKNAEIRFSKEFSRSTYLRMMKGVMLAFLYLTLFPLWNYLFVLIFKDPSTNLLNWSIFNAAFFILVLYILGKQKSRFLSILLLPALFSILLYPVLVHDNIARFRNAYLQADPSYLWPFLTHYLALLLMILLMIQVFMIIYRKFAGKNEYFRLFYLLAMGLGLFILLSEYDHLTVIMNYGREQTIQNIIEENHRLPFTLLIMGYSFLVLLIALRKKISSLRLFALLLFASAIFRFLFFNLTYLNAITTTLLLFIIGVILILFALFYRKIEHKKKRISDHKPLNPDA